MKLADFFRSIRSRLIASYALVIVLSLVLAGTSFAYLLQSYQSQLRLTQIADLALPLGAQVKMFERAGASSQQIDQFLREQSSELNVRIFLVNSNRRIIDDTGGTLVGKTLPAPSSQILRPRVLMQWGTLSLTNLPRMTFVAVLLQNDRLPGDRHTDGITDTPPTVPPSSTVAPTDDVVLAVPEESVTTAWLRLAPRLAAAAIAALIVSIAVALIIARSMARPLVQLTKASQRMARGDFEQNIPVHGQDEVGQLAQSFNHMAHEVGLMHRTMRDLLANVTHELRTPLTSIQGFAQAMVDGTIKTPEEYAEAGRIIGEEATRMHRLVEDLLYLSKIESGQVRIERSDLDLPELLHTCVRLVQREAENAGLALEVDTPPVPSVSADGHRLQQVFVNLLDNALKHTPPGGKIQVKAYAEPDRIVRIDEVGRRKAGQNWIAVDVHNTGSHIPASDLDRIFERFYQVDRSRARNHDGSGLGLAIVQEIIQAHEGKITVKSDPIAGTTFTVHLPAA
ncbi:MAG TPA: ATP-binding protein [Chloroflexota bacterium]|nr:ATP-binding protein [Chloroflexota bacterium]